MILIKVVGLFNWFSRDIFKCTYFNFILFFTLILNYNQLFAQSYFSTGSHIIYKIEIDDSQCSECSFNFVAPTTAYPQGISFGPDTNLYYETSPDLEIMDTITGNSTLYFTAPGMPPNFSGLVSVGGGIFYSMDSQDEFLWKYDVNAGTLSVIGSTGYSAFGDLTMYNGEIYYTMQGGIIKLDVNIPSNSSLVVSMPSDYLISGITASHICNSLLALLFIESEDTYELVHINLIDGAITSVCSVPSNISSLTRISSMLEHSSAPSCDNYIDLDCNDSSGATEADYISPDFNCLSDGVGIADEDIKIIYDAIITEMTIEVTGFVPDAPNEILDIIGSVPNIDVTGAGTDMIILSNAGGATSRDFKDALRLVRYINTALYPTAGLRTVEVQFTTESGESSNIATAFINVEELPLIEVDLGPDHEVCEGLSVTLDAGNPGAQYSWSNNQTSQVITVTEEDEYIVTVSNGINCPNQDTVVVDVLPAIHVFLTAEAEICYGEDASITIHTDSDIPLTIEVASNPGSNFSFNNITGNFTFTDSPSETTEYTITNVIPSEDACLEITEPTQFVVVNPVYLFDVDVSMCDGDSVFLGYYWETEAGIYDVIFQSVHGCDSTVFYTVGIEPVINVSLQSTTCDSSEIGIFLSFIDNPSGCDTLLTTTVSLISPDTTHLTGASCNLSATGVFENVFTNQLGCDSVIITTISLIPPADTTKIFQTTCDSSALGVFQHLLIDQGGCDSLIQTTVTMAPADTSYINGISCDPASIGVFQSLLSNQSGCDSLVITTINAGVPDTSYFSTTSCDSASLGVFEDHFISQSGCDSTVITTVTYSASDSTFINSSSCNPVDTGVFVQNLINRFGCDSIVTSTVAYAISHYNNILASSCDPAEVGVFTDSLINQYGCDSIVTITVELLPSDATELFSSTCISSQAGVFVTNLINQHGCDSIVTLTVSLVAADTSIISFKTCNPGQVGSTEELFTGQDGCDSLVISETTLYPLPVLNAVVSSDYNGYAISCFGESDGSATANVTGTLPFSYLWSTGSPDLGIANLPEGTYSVTITDGNGCIANDEVLLTSPPEFSISLVVSQPDCFDNDKGSITVQQAGGIEPIRYSIDGINYQPTPIFNNLSDGTYQISALDANDCEVKEIIWINVPLMVNVDLGDDLIILPGDTSIIEAIVNVPFDSLASINWSGLVNPDCPNCLTQIVAPIITTTYSVSVTSHDGCSDKDSMTLFVESDTDIYVPNIFSPNGDNANDRLLISAGKDVEKISSFVIYDRWGDMVFSAKDFFPNDESKAWDGKLRGRFLNPGVFAYRLIVVHIDGSFEVRYGDVTLIK